MSSRILSYVDTISQQYGQHPRLQRFIKSYAPDWIITGVLWVILRIVNDYVSGFKRHFSLSDISLLYPYAIKQRVGSTALRIISCGIPLAIQCLVNLFTIRSWLDLHHSTLGLMLSLSMTGTITQLVKVTVGRPRPDLISRCQPTLGSEDPLLGLSTVAICTQTSSKILEDGWRSFPSGHSSASFAGLGFLTFYLAGKLHLFDNRGHVGKAWLSLIPLSGAAYVAISRTMDYRHHWEDVMTGSALGLLLAYFSYRQYYPHLASEDAHVPYATRFEEAEIEEAEVMDPLIRYEEGSEEISTRRNPKTGIRR